MSSTNGKIFECCKKAFLNCICINCSNVYHRTCLTKKKETIQYLTGNKIICCQSQEVDSEVDVSALEKTIQDLSDETQMKEKHIEKFKKIKDDIMEEALRNESDMLLRMEEQQKLIGELRNHIKELEQQLGRYSKERKTSSTQTSIKCMDKQTMTKDTSVHHEKNSLTSIQVKQAGITIKDTIVRNNGSCRSTSQKIRNKILLVAGKHGRGLLKYLIPGADENYTVQSILKPNATNAELLETAVNNSVGFNMQDVVILWYDKTRHFSEYKWWSNFKHTRLIILTEPYRYDIDGTNDIIYDSNLRLFQEIMKLKSPVIKVLECNHILKKSNYLYDRSTLSSIGKKFLCKKLFSLISNMIETGNAKEHRSQNEPRHDFPRTICQYPTISSDSTPNSETFASNGRIQEPSFLYPRLSQVAPTLV